MNSALANFTDVLDDMIDDSQPMSISSDDSLPRRENAEANPILDDNFRSNTTKPKKGTGQHGKFRSVEEIEEKYRGVFTYPYFNLVQSSVIEDALYSDKSMVVCAPTGSGKTVVFEMAIVQLLRKIEETKSTEDYKIIYMAPVKALCTERITEWYPKFTKLGLLCIEVTGDTDVDFLQLKSYRIIITTPEKWDMLTRRWRDHRYLVEMIKLFLIDEVHILNDVSRGPVLEAVVSRMKTIESTAQSTHRIELLKNKYQGTEVKNKAAPPKIRFIAVSATVSNPEDVAAWLGTATSPAVFHKFGDECRPVKLKKVVEGYPCSDGTSIFKFDIILNYKLWPIIQKYYNGKPTLIFCNTRKGVLLTAETLSKEITVNFHTQQKEKLMALASSIKNKKLQTLLINGVGCHHAGLLFEERTNIERAFRNMDLPILITTTTLAMGVNLPAHLVIIKNTKQYVNGAYQDYSISTVLQMVGRAGRPQYDTEATAVIMTTLRDKPRYQALVGGSEPLQSYLHKRLAENLNSEAALGTVGDVAQCVQWLSSTFLYVRAGRDPRRYLGLPPAASQEFITKKIEELCVIAMNGLASSGMITMDEACFIQSTEAGRLMSIYYLDLDTMKNIMKINGSETLEQLLWVICECHELADKHLRMDERRLLNTLNRNSAAATIRFPMKGKITTRQMKLNCIIQAVLGCLPISDPSLTQEALQIMRIADRICKCLVAYVTRPELINMQSKFYSAVLNSLILAKCISSQLWENSPYVSKQLKGIGPIFSNLLATAGKVNFMLLEESHPRDLERIINKGPPFGNVLHKLFTLLPKYQLSVSPIDQNSVSVHLLLLNQAHLSENLEELTAGDAHKCYIVVGDSENNIHLLSSFKDKDLISTYDGSITYQITRKHKFEHKIFVHCISSSFVGLDTQCEYLFIGLEPPTSNICLSLNESNINKKTCKRQTTITDTFKERKRKANDDITQSKEKKKRNSAIMVKFHNLKESFGKTSKEVKDELHKTVDLSNNILNEYMRNNQSSSHIMDPKKDNSEDFGHRTLNDLMYLDIETEEICSDEENDEKIDSILQEITKEANCHKDNVTNETILKSLVSDTTSKQSNFVHNKMYFQSNYAIRPYKIKGKFNKKSNYNFIELLEKNTELTDEEDTPIKNNNISFTDTIKNQIDIFLKNNCTDTNAKNAVIEKLIKESANEDLRSVSIKECYMDNKDKTNFKDTTGPPSTKENNSDVIKTVDNPNNALNKVENGSYTVMTQCNSLCPLAKVNTNLNVNNNKIYKYLNNASSSNNSDALHTINLLNDFRPYCSIDNNLCTSEINLNTESALTLYSSNDANTQNIESMLIEPYLQYDHQLNKIQTEDKTFENKLNKEINLPSEDKQIPMLDIPKDKLPSTAICQIKRGSEKPDIRKYSYSITNIDYSTKNMPGHLVKVARKLKLDVDITEIIEKKKNDDSIKTKEVIGEEWNSNINLQNEEVVNDSTTDIVTNKTSTEHTDILSAAKEIDHKAESENDVKTHCSSNEQSVSQILQKYFNLCRKKKELIFTPQKQSKINNNDKPARSKIDKPKRPFKINQVDNIKVQLPENIIQNNPNTVTTTVEELRKTPDILLKIPNLPDTENVRLISPPVEQLENNSSESEYNVTLDLEATDNFHIDQSMFDPKTLLRTLNAKNNDEDIIPPPPEFLDHVPQNVVNEPYAETSYNNSNLDLNVNLQNDASKYMETWTLSRDNTTDNEVNNYGRYIPRNQYSAVRRHKLGQFSFSQKEKLKK